MYALMFLSGVTTLKCLTVYLAGFRLDINGYRVDFETVAPPEDIATANVSDEMERTFKICYF